MEPFSEPYQEASASGGDSSCWESVSDPDQLEDTRKPIMCQSDIRTYFKILVKNIADDITDLEKLRYMSDAVQTGQVKSQSALDILWVLERKGKFAYNNIGPLEKLLQDVDRCDLVSKYIVPYKQTYGELAINGAIESK